VKVSIATAQFVSHDGARVRPSSWGRQFGLRFRKAVATKTQ
jgi:hypothetical protein